VHYLSLGRKEENRRTIESFHPQCGILLHMAALVGGSEAETKEEEIYLDLIT